MASSLLSVPLLDWLLLLENVRVGGLGDRLRVTNEINDLWHCNSVWLSMFCESYEYGVELIDLLGPLLHGLLIVGFVNISYGYIMHIFSKLFSHIIISHLTSNFLLLLSFFYTQPNTHTHTTVDQDCCHRRPCRLSQCFRTCHEQPCYYTP